MNTARIAPGPPTDLNGIKRTSKVTAAALAIFSIGCFPAGIALLGLGMSQTQLAQGTALVPYIAGYYLQLVSTGLIISAGIMGCIHLYAKRLSP